MRYEKQAVIQIVYPSKMKHGKDKIVDVGNEAKVAKKLALWGIIMVAVGLIFILVSFLLWLYGWAELNGWGGLKNVVGNIYGHTQLPVLSSIWKIAAQPDLNEPLQLQSLGFIAEVVIFMVGAVMMGAAILPRPRTRQSKNAAKNSSESSSNKNAR